MKKRLTQLVVSTVLLSGFFISLVFMLSEVAQKDIQSVPKIYVTESTPKNISAKSAYVFDLESGVEIYTKNTQEVLPVASVTKLLSAAMFYEYADLSATATVQWSDIQTEGRSGRLQAGQKYTARDMLFPTLLESSNDATVLMQRVLEKTLVEKMNSYAQDTQLQVTSFSDASGLSDKNVSTAYELGELASSIYLEYPHIFDITRLKTYINHINAWMNNNPFVGDVGYRGGKHGYTYKANRTAVAFFEEQLKTGQSQIFGYVLLGSDDLPVDMQELRSYVLENVRFE